MGVCAVVGNFDDAQTGVKKLFSDEKLRETLTERGYVLLLCQLHQLGPCCCRRSSTMSQLMPIC